MWLLPDLKPTLCDKMVLDDFIGWDNDSFWCLFRRLDLDDYFKKIRVQFNIMRFSDVARIILLKDIVPYECLGAILVLHKDLKLSALVSCLELPNVYFKYDLVIAEIFVSTRVAHFRFFFFVNFSFSKVLWLLKHCKSLFFYFSQWFLSIRKNEMLCLHLRIGQSFQNCNGLQSVLGSSN